MKKVAFFSGFYLPFLGGVERYTYNISQKLLENGYEVIIITSQHDNNLLNKEIVDGIKIYRLPIKRFGKKRYPFLKKNRRYRELVQEIRDENIDYFISNTRFQTIAILGTQFAKEQGKEAIVIEHGTTYLTLNNRLLDIGLHKIERFLIDKVKKNTTKFYGVSQEAAKWLTEFDIVASGVVYNAVKVSDFKKFYVPKTTNELIISYSGRLQAKFKGVETLLSSFTDISKEFANIKLIIAGDGPIYQEMKKKYTQDNIEFLGKISHDKVMELNNRSDIFVLLSKIEGFSTSMIEAAMMKNVVITTDVGGARELIPSNDYGYIIKNSKEELVKTLRTILTDTEKRQMIQERVSKRVKNHFTWDITAKAFIEIFEGIDEEINK